MTKEIKCLENWHYFSNDVAFGYLEPHGRWENGDGKYALDTIPRDPLCLGDRILSIVNDGLCCAFFSRDNVKNFRKVSDVLFGLHIRHTPQCLFGVNTVNEIIHVRRLQHCLASSWKRLLYPFGRNFFKRSHALTRTRLTPVRPLDLSKAI